MFLKVYSRNIFLKNVFQNTFHEFRIVCYEKPSEKNNPEVIKKNGKTLFLKIDGL